VHYVYLLVSARSRSRRYVGVTTDLKQRFGALAASDNVPKCFRLSAGEVRM